MMLGLKTRGQTLRLALHSAMLFVPLDAEETSNPTVGGGGCVRTISSQVVLGVYMVRMTRHAMGLTLIYMLFHGAMQIALSGTTATIRILRRNYCANSVHVLLRVGCAALRTLGQTNAVQLMARPLRHPPFPQY